MERGQEENYLSYVKRVTDAVLDNRIGYQEWSESILNDSPYGDETLRRCANWFSSFLEQLDIYQFEGVSDSALLAEIEQAKAEYERERVKVAEEKKELKETYRWQARNELYQEKMIAAINRLEPITIPNIKIKDHQKIGTTALMCVSDIHAGANFEVKGLYGEVVNKYDYEIMQGRFWKLLNDFQNDDIVCDDITFAILGDCFENVLRISSLSKLREPVLDTVIKFSEFLANYIAELQRQTELPINVVTVGGNHDVQRLLGSKPSFEDENLTKIVVEFLKLRLKDFPYITVDDYQEIAVKNIRKNQIMFQHGEDKDLQVTLDYFSNLYNLDIDEIIAGHYHRPESKSIGITDVGDRTLTRVGSIVGTDTYAKKIRVSARPSAYVAIYTEDGKTWSRNYYL